MNFYRRRPLALAISLCLVLSGAAAYLPGVLKVIFMLLIAAGVPAAVLIVRHRYGFVPSVAPYAFLTAALMLACLLTSYAYYDIHIARHTALSKGTVRATVIEIRSETDYSSSYTVRLDTVDGERLGGKGVLYSQSALSMGLGDILESEVVFTPLADAFSYTGGSVRSAIAEGYVFACEAVDEVRLVGESNAPEVWFSELRAYLSAVMGLYLGRDECAMADALFLGIRDGLGVIRRDFTYMGVTHLLALSGLHIAVIGGAMEKFLAFLRVGKRVSSIILTLLLLFYVALTGFLLSAVRAALMMIISYAASALGRDNDRVTSLFTAVWLIAFVNPSAIWDAGLQMSFFATLGVMLMAEATERRLAELNGIGGVGKKIKRFFGSIGASVGAAMFVLPLQWLYFGEASLMSIPATLMLSAVCEGMLILYIPYIILALLKWHSLCGLFAGVITLLYRLCAFIAHELAQVSSTVSLNYPFTAPIVILCAAAVVIMMVKNVRSWLWALVPYTASVLLFLACVRIYNTVYADRIVVDYINYGSNDIFLAVSGGTAVAVDMTGGSVGAMRELRYTLAKEYVTEIDTLVLTDISVKHINSTRALLKNRVVHTILTPMAKDTSEVYLINSLEEVATEYGAEVNLYARSSETELMLKDLTVTFPRYIEIKRSVRPLTAMILERGEMTVSYAGTASWEDEYIWDFVGGAQYMIIGSNGPNYRTPPTGEIPETVERIYCPTSEVISNLGAWLQGFDGEIIEKAKVRIVMEP